MLTFHQIHFEAQIWENDETIVGQLIQQFTAPRTAMSENLRALEQSVWAEESEEEKLVKKDLIPKIEQIQIEENIWNEKTYFSQYGSISLSQSTVSLGSSPPPLDSR